MVRKISREAMRASLLYGLIASLWILISDQALFLLLDDPSAFARLTIFKGLAFVAITTVLLHATLRGGWHMLELESARRRLAEEDLQKNETQLRAMFQMASIGIAQADPHTGQWLSVNERMCAITGYSADEMLGMNILKITHPEDCRRDWEAFQRVVRGEIPNYRLEKRYLRKDGSVAWVNVNMTVLRDAAGKPTRTVAAIEEISDRKRAEEAVRESEAQYRLLFESTRDALMVLAPETFQFTRANRATLAMFRAATEADFTKYGPRDVSPERQPDGRASGEKAREMIQTALREGSHFFEWTYRRLDGEIFPTEVLLTRLQFNGQTIVQVAAHDITERRRAEDAVRKSVEQYRKLFEEATEGIVLADAETGILLDCNRAFSALTEYDRAELVGRHQSILHPADDGQTPVSRTFARHRAEDEGAVLPACLVTRSGAVRQVEIKANVLDIAGRGVMQGFFRDVTADVRHRREQEMTLDLLRLLNEQRETRNLIHGLTDLLHDWSGCEAVGIRLREGDDFPYFETLGFPAEFMEAENHPCARDLRGVLERDSRGDPVYECICGNVLCGRFNPALPFFTPKGSFWTNCTTDLPATTDEADRQARTRNRCHGEGYESVALIALRHGDRTFGLLQLNDRAKGRFSPELLAFLEKTADQIAIALAQRQARDALRESEERYRALFENAAEAIVVAQDGRLIFVNPAAEVISGYGRAELTGRPFIEFVYAEDRPRLMANYERQINGEPVRNVEKLRIVKKDGTVRWLQSTTATIVWRGNPATLDFLTDVTEQVRQEREITLLNRLYAVLSHVNQAVVRATSPEGLFEQACQVIVEEGQFLMAWIGRVDLLTKAVAPVAIWGSAREYVNRIAVSADDRPEGRGPVGTCIRTNRPFVCNDFLHDARTRPWQAEAAPHGIRAVAGFPIRMAEEVWGALTIYADETDFFGDKEVKLLAEVADDIGFALDNLEHDRRRRQAESSLRESEQFNREVIACAREGVIVYDADFRYQVWNPFMEELTGMPAAEVLGSQCFTHFPHLKEEGVDKLLLQALAGESVSTPDIRFHVPRTGKSGWISGVYSPHYGPNGAIGGVIGIVRDVTERKLAEESHNKIEAQLFQAQKMESVGRLAGGVAHDFNNMLSIIIGYAEIIKQRILPTDAIYHEIHEILEAGLRSSELTRQLLAFARRQTAVPRVLDLNDTVSGLLKMLRRLIGEDIDLAWRPDRALWKVRVDPSQVDQILANLAVNARDAIGGVGRIDIETSNVLLDAPFCAGHAGCVPGEYVMLAMQDSGMGMSREVLEQIFEPFFTTKELGKGTGLGLATVYGIVSQNNGCIDVASEPARGSSFKIYLPRHLEKINPGQAEKAGLQIRGGTETLLLVEDADPLLELGKIVLETLGYTVLAASNPQQAIQLVEQFRGAIDLLITDVVMPGMNGRELMERLRSVRPDMKGLYMSGYTADVIAHHGVLDEGVNFIQKPFRRDDFARTVRNVLERN